MGASAVPLQPGSIPIPRTQLIGRETERAAAQAYLLDQAVPLLTLIGPGGVGKTRLALAIAGHIATDVADGVVWVDLAPLADPALVPAALGVALGVNPTPHGSPVDDLIRALHARHMVLLLDNCEHVITAITALVGSLLPRCPTLQVLATSRTPLRLRGEQVLPVEPLPLPAIGPAPLTVIAQNAAVRLFIERAQAAQPRFTVTNEHAGMVAEICRRLDGLPLAIELAAARIPVLPLPALLARLDRRLALLTEGPRDVPARQQTMRDTIVWSYDLLTPEEQQLFRRLAVFTGGCTFEAASVVAGDGVDVLDGLSALVANSLLRQEDGPGHEPRYVLLETLREFGLEQLAVAGEAAEIRGRHAAYFAAFDERLNPNRLAPDERFDDRLWSIEAELPNVRAALTQLADTGDAEGVLRLAGALAVFWQVRAHLQEGRQWLEWGLAHTAETPTASRGVALVGLALICWAHGDYAQTAVLADAALDIADHCNDRYIAAFAIHLLGEVAEAQQRWHEAESLLEQALGLWRVLGAHSEGAMALHLLGDVAYGLGDRDRAARRSQESLALFRAIGYASGAALTLCRLAVLARDAQDASQAALIYHEALRLWAGVRERWLLVLALAGLAELASAHGEAPVAATLLGSIEALATATGAPLFPTARINADRAATAARVTLGAVQFAERHAAGRQLPLGEAVTLATVVANRIAHRSASRRPGARSATNPLTARELDVLRLVATARTDQEIADALFLSRRTVNGHLGRILAKFEVHTRRDAVARGRALGLIADRDTPPGYT